MLQGIQFILGSKHNPRLKVPKQALGQGHEKHNEWDPLWENKQWAQIKENNEKKSRYGMVIVQIPKRYPCGLATNLDHWLRALLLNFSLI